MGDKSAIQWTEASWNPLYGCTKISPECANCYIEHTPPFRTAGLKFVKGHIPIQFHDNRMDQPLRWKRPRRIFVNSLSDIFHKDVPDAFIGKMFAVMAQAHWHTFQVLTKRADRLLEWSRGVAHYPHGDTTQKPVVGWPPNVWVGVSAGNQRMADLRVPLLLKTSASVRWVSYEPALASVDWREHFDSSPCDHHRLSCEEVGCRGPRGLDWIVVGGESGAKARPFHVEWALDTIKQGRTAGVPVFVKQLGGSPFRHGLPLRLKDRKGGNIAEWNGDLCVREYPKAA